MTCKFAAVYLKSSVYNGYRKLQGFAWENCSRHPSHGCVDAANVGYQNGICNANQAATAMKTENKKNNNNRSTYHVQHTSFVHFLAVVLQDDNVKLPETSRNFLVTHFMKEMLYVVLFTFFRCRSFLPWWPLAFLIFSQPQ